MLQLAFVNFKKSSYILMDGYPANDRFYIIQSGKVSCHRSTNPGTAPEILGPGDFVGVVPCMSGHNQNQNVIAMTDVVAIMVRKDQYPELIRNNTPVAMKIIRAFSHEMRNVNNQLTKITLNKTGSVSSEELFTIADYYEKNDDLNIAVYGYYQYIKENPKGIHIEDAKKRFLALKPRTKAVYFESTPELVRSYPKDSMVFSDCQHGSDMFIIQSGSVRITKVIDGSEVILALLNKGDMFGEMALLENQPRSASIIAHEDCKLMVVNRANFDQMVATQPQMISKLTTMLAERLWGMYRQLSNAQLSDMRERLVDMIALQLEKLKVPAARNTNYATNFTTMDIIKLCGIPEGRYSEALMNLQSETIIKVAFGKINVPDVDNLYKQAAFYRKQNIKKLNEALR